MPVDDQGDAYTSAQADQEHALRTPAGTDPLFGYRGDHGIVIDQHRDAQTSFQACYELEAGKAGKRVGIVDRPPDRINRATRTDAQAQQLCPGWHKREYRIRESIGPGGSRADGQIRRIQPSLG
jgi:hypothetical protein